MTVGVGVSATMIARIAGVFATGVGVQAETAKIKITSKCLKLILITLFYSHLQLFVEKTDGALHEQEPLIPCERMPLPLVNK